MDKGVSKQRGGRNAVEGVHSGFGCKATVRWMRNELQFSKLIVCEFFSSTATNRKVNKR